jgi:hypothetical protein
VAYSKFVSKEEKTSVKKVVKICLKPQWRGKEIWEESRRFPGG